MDGIFLSIVPPSDEDWKPLPVYHQRGQTPLVFTVIGRTIRGVWLHWEDETNRSYPCTGTICPCLVAPTRRIWKGYVHATNKAGNTEAVIEMTACAAVKLTSTLQGRSPQGWTLSLARDGRHKNARQTIEVVSVGNYQDMERAERDIRMDLNHLWGFRPDYLQWWENLK